MSWRVEETGLSSLSSADTLLQSELWARFKSEYGWSAHAFVPVEGPWMGSPVLTLVRVLGAGLELAYVPYAPAQPREAAPAADNDVTDRSEGVVRSGDLADLGAAVAAALPRVPTCVRFDLLWPAGSLPAGRAGSPARLRKAPVDVQPPATVEIDLSPDPDDILAAMHKKNRYNVRLAERKGVAVRTAGADEMTRWYGLYRETARRDRITIHPEAYYRRLFELAGDDPGISVRLYLAEHESDLLAGIIVVRTGERATYLYGASSDLKRNLMPNYALQWSAMTDAKASGAAVYDLFGVPPADDPAHPMHGLYRFKTGFGGALVERAGCWDYVCRPVAYAAYRMAERARSYYFHRVRKAGAR